MAPSTNTALAQRPLTGEATVHVPESEKVALLEALCANPFSRRRFSFHSYNSDEADSSSVADYVLSSEPLPNTRPTSAPLFGAPLTDTHVSPQPASESYQQKIGDPKTSLPYASDDPSRASIPPEIPVVAHGQSSPPTLSTSSIPPSILLSINGGKPLTRFTRSFPAKTGSGATTWTRSSNDHPIVRPPGDLLSALGDLHLHYDSIRGVTQMWVMGDDGWQSVEQGSSHPSASGRCLRIRDDGDPSWVKTRSLSSMASRARRRAGDN
ncbi:hypothetical protein BJ138DRAFT_1165760 [Hygrophoropsis aurantiaca]|uniref:Uncharacterized protein n=1 Tax=Hygrophoropsis aurantiaca TaxID=72124 RepID=A0ACB7ZV16_9AGAM|nr:hypothetical protein BJ138DRAFT_1165760 [Hygrophoropsis aurantiaca]